MPTLSVTERGQVTFRQEVLRHLGIRPGDKIQLDLLPGNRAQLSAERPRGSWDKFQGSLKGKTSGVTLTIDEINEAIAEAGAAAGLGEHGEDHR
jgi:bifunctional DNA-binding transcriptional regulator/antitoxin component of YhaV-PrlF toxin-antitoxin module